MYHDVDFWADHLVVRCFCFVFGYELIMLTTAVSVLDLLQVPQNVITSFKSYLYIIIGKSVLVLMLKEYLLLNSVSLINVKVLQDLCSR